MCIRDRLKEAKHVIAQLRQALDKQKEQSPPSEYTDDSPEDTPETPPADDTPHNHAESTSKMNTEDLSHQSPPDAEMKAPTETEHANPDEEMHAHPETSHQAIGAALKRKERATIHTDHDVTEEEEIIFHDIEIGESSATTSSGNNSETNEAPSIDISIRSHASSSAQSYVSFASSDEELTDPSSSSGDTQVLYTNLTKTKNPPHTPTKNAANTDGPSDSLMDPAGPQPLGLHSGLQMAHQPSQHPSGLAGDPPQAAGLSD